MQLRSIPSFIRAIPQTSPLWHWLIVTIHLSILISLWAGFLTTKFANAQSNQLVVSQLYGGGGNSGATLQSDFIEILNISTASVDVSNMSIQYASASGSTWKTTPLGAHIMPPGSYLLIKQASGSGGSDTGTTLEFPDVVGDISMAMGSGKVALVANADPIDGMTDPDVIDFVGYGSANEAEGLDMDGETGASLSSTTALWRLGNGCADTDNNAADFEKASPEPRNSITVSASCVTLPPSTTDAPAELPEPTSTSTATSTPTETPIETTEPAEPLPTETLDPTATWLPTAAPIEPIETPPSDTPTFIPTPIATPISTQVLLPSATTIPSPVDTPLSTPTQINTIEPTNAEIPTEVPTAIDTDVPPTVAATPTMFSPTAMPTMQTIESTPTATATNTWTATHTPTAIVTIPEAATIPPTPTILVTAPQLWITEVMVNPSAVSDTSGEWCEIFNPNDFAVDLLGWLLSDGGSDNHTIEESIVIPAGGYVLLARNADVTVNGGVSSDYVYSNLQLSNSEDRLILTAPSGIVVDQVLWNQQMDVAIPAGASLERNVLGNPASWTTALASWLGSTGDFGTPGENKAALIPTAAASTQTPVEISPTPTAQTISTAAPTTPDTPSPQILTPTPADYGNSSTPMPTASQTISASPVPTVIAPTPESTVAPQPKPQPTLQPTSQPFLLISEVMVNPKAVADSDGEYIEIWNGSSDAVNLNGYGMTDLGTESHTIADDLWVPANGVVILGRNDRSSENGGFQPDYIFTGSSLANGGDELLLLAPDGIELDRIVWADGLALSASAGASFERTELSLPGEWVTATQLWPGSWGDLGSPGFVYTSRLGQESATTNSETTRSARQIYYLPIYLIMTAGDAGPIATSVPDLDNQMEPTATATVMASPTAKAQALSTTIVTPINAANTQAVASAQIFISEVMANPKAVSDSVGEYVEICNRATFAINLESWTLADLGSERYTIDSTVWVQPGGCVVLGRNAEHSENGGLIIHHVYNGINLSNSADELVLIAPDGTQADHVEWEPQSELVVRAGASFERVVDASTTLWVTAQEPWAGSAGDAGSPGEMTRTTTTANQLESQPTPIPEATVGIPIESTATQIATSITISPPDSLLAQNSTDQGDSKTSVEEGNKEPGHSDALSASELNPADDYASEPSALLDSEARPETAAEITAYPQLWISEFMADPAGISDHLGEWFKIFNPNTESVNLQGWSLADSGKDEHLIAVDLVIEPGESIQLARSLYPTADDNIEADYVYDGVNLANTNDEIVLVAPNNLVMDKVAWGEEEVVQITTGMSLQRQSWDATSRWATAADTAAETADHSPQAIQATQAAILDANQPSDANGLGRTALASASHSIKTELEPVDPLPADPSDAPLSQDALPQAIDPQLSHVESIGQDAPSAGEMTTSSPRLPTSTKTSTKTPARLSVGLTAYLRSLSRNNVFEADNDLAVEHGTDRSIPHDDSAPRIGRSNIATPFSKGEEEAIAVSNFSPSQGEVSITDKAEPDIAVCLNFASNTNDEGGSLWCGVLGTYQGKTTLFLNPSQHLDNQHDGIRAQKKNTDYPFQTGSLEWYVAFFAFILVGMLMLNWVLMRSAYRSAYHDKSISKRSAAP